MTYIVFGGALNYSLTLLLLFILPLITEQVVRPIRYFNIWRGGPPGHRTNRPTWQVSGSQVAQSAPGRGLAWSRSPCIRPGGEVICYTSW